MKFMKQLLPIASLALVFAVSGKADLVITSTAGATFSDLANAGTFNNDGPEFFDTATLSDDNKIVGTECGIGALLSGQTAINSTNCKDLSGAMNTLPAADGIYQYLNNGSGGNVENFIIFSELGVGDITLQLELAQGKNLNKLEVINLSTFTVDATFDGADTSGAKKSLTISAGELYGFRFTNRDNQTFDTWTSSSNFRFALFRLDSFGNSSNLNVGRYVLGVEDGVDNDFQDMVLYANVVPEPASVIALSGAVLGTLVMVRRRRQAKK